jgi:hypothetical protein
LLFGGEAISSKQGIASGYRPRNDMDGNWSDYETMMQESSEKISLRTG